MNTRMAYNIRSLTHAYDSRIVLDIPSLDIPAGGLYAITGSNGSGKTTLLSILALLLNPRSGSVLLQGVESTRKGDRRRLRRSVTLVHQKPVLFSTTVRHNISYGLRSQGMSSAECNGRLQTIMHNLKLTSMAGERAQRLSGGEAQRVVLARGLAMQTPILLLDEPTNSLDDGFKPLLSEMISEANRSRGTTVILATHDLNWVASLGCRMIRLQDGKIGSESVQL
jgi:tungstate transport system ATP-binding protein